MQELFQVLLPCSGSLFGAIERFAEAQNKCEVGQIMTVWLFDPDFFLNWGVDKSVFDVPMLASVTCVRVVNAHHDTQCLGASNRSVSFMVVNAFSLEATHGSKSCLEFDN